MSDPPRESPYSPSLAVEHERGLACFLRTNRRERFVQGLQAGGAARDKILRRLPHFEDLDPRYRQPAPEGAGWDEAALVSARLRELGSPSTVYVVSDIKSVDGRFMELNQALQSVLSQDAGSLLSCVPGKLGLYEGETPGDRYALIRV